MKVLGLFGSPRRGGNTDSLLEEFLKGAMTARAEIDRIYVRDLKIAPCAEHMVCQKTGACIIQDDMQPVYQQLVNADRIVLAAPVFFYNLPAQTKALVDRCQVLWAKKYILKTPPPSQINGITRKGFFISTGGTNGAKLFDGTILTIKYFFDAIGVTYSGDLLFKNIGHKEAIQKHPTALTEAFNKGKDWLET